MKFILKGYNETSCFTSNDEILIEVFADTEDSAITKAKGLCRREIYKVERAIELNEDYEPRMPNPKDANKKPDVDMCNEIKKFSTWFNEILEREITESDY